MSKREWEAMLARESAVIEATEAICEMMDSRNVTRDDLAAMLGVSPARVNKIFSGRRSMTIEDLAEIAHLLGFRLHMHCYQVRWVP